MILWFLKLTQLRHRRVRFAVDQKVTVLHGAQGNHALGQEVNCRRASFVLHNRERLQTEAHNEYNYSKHTLNTQ